MRAMRFYGRIGRIYIVRRRIGRIRIVRVLNHAREGKDEVKEFTEQPCS